MTTPVSFDPAVVNKDLDLLYPVFARLVQSAITDAFVQGGLRCAVFEAYRAPNRQAWLYSQGRDAPGKIVTQAQPWQSWHQFGVAVDIVYVDAMKRPSWDGDFSKLVPYFTKYGLEHPLPQTDAGHYELTGGLNLAIAKGLYMNAGLQRVWLECSAKLTPPIPPLAA